MFISGSSSAFPHAWSLMNDSFFCFLFFNFPPRNWLFPPWGISPTLWRWHFQQWVFPPATWKSLLRISRRASHASKLDYGCQIPAMPLFCFVEKLVPVSLWGSFVSRTVFFFGGGVLLLEGVCAWLPGLPITTHSKQCSCWPSQLSHSDKCHFVNCVKSTVEPAA